MINKNFLKTYSASLLLAIIALYAINYFNISYPVKVTTSNTASELAVVGEGKVEVKPDFATIRVGVTLENEENLEALREKINGRNNEILVALGKLGIDKKNIKTSNYSIYPAYDQNGKQSGKYNGSVELEIKTKKVDEVSQIIQTATNSGANQVYGFESTVENPAQYREEARNKAIQNAREQAEKLAKQLGIRLGRVVNVYESSQGEIPGVYKTMDIRYAGGGGGGPEISQGTQTISSVVTLYFDKR